MPKRTTFHATAAAFALALGAAPLIAQDEKPKPGNLSSDEIAAAGENYLVPSPGDLLDAVGSQDGIDWAALSTAISADPAATKSDYPIDAVKAANLGIRVADAFVALYAQNAEQFTQSANVVKKLAGELSEIDIEEMTSTVEGLLDDGKWDAVNNELEALRFDVILELIQYDDQDSVTLAEVGGWLRGLELVSQSLLDSGKTDASGVLRQGKLVAHLRDEVAALSEAAKGIEAVQSLDAGLAKIDELTTKGTDATFSTEEITQIRDTAGGLIAGLRS